RRRHRHPVPADALPSPARVLMTHKGAVIFTDISGEIADDDVVRRFYPDISVGDGPLLWATWRRPTLEELVQTWPSRTSPNEQEIKRGWWSPTLDELREERRKARSIEQAQATRGSRDRADD